MLEVSTQLMRQYAAIKREYPQTLLFFRLGDFYELFFEDAVLAARELEITLTSRNKEKGIAIPMCGVPYHSAENYIAKLIRKGFKVAVCDQMEDARLAKQLVRRQVTRVVTPGTAADSTLEAEQNNFLAAVCVAQDAAGFAALDLSTGEFRATEFQGPDAHSRLEEELQQLRPRELLYAVTCRNLELIEPIFNDAGAEATWFRAMDATLTPMGKRLLRSWMLRPSIDAGEIQARLDAVEAMSAATIEREQLRQPLDGVLDIERLLSRVTLESANPRDLLALAASLARVPQVRQALAGFSGARLQELHQSLDELSDVRQQIETTLAPEPPLSFSDGGVIAPGIDGGLDELRDLSHNSRQHILAIEQRERQRTGIGSLKVKFNSVFGYYIEISKANQHLAPADYERKQTLVNAERFRSEERRVGKE